MKATKALKRLAKIDALLSDVAARYSVNDSDIRQVLQDARAAVARAKEIVSLQAAAPARKKAAAKKAKGRATTAKTAKKKAPIKKAAKRKAATMTASAVVQAASETYGTSVNLAKSSEQPDPASSRTTGQPRSLSE